MLQFAVENALTQGNFTILGDNDINSILFWVTALFWLAIALLYAWQFPPKNQLSLDFAIRMSLLFETNSWQCLYSFEHSSLISRLKSSSF